MSRFRRRGKNTPTMTLRVDRLDHLVLNVRDVERAAEWYAHVLGMERRDFVASAGGERRIALYAGAQKINLRPVAADPRTWLTADCATAGSDDLCFITTGPLEDAVAHLGRMRRATRRRHGTASRSTWPDDINTTAGIRMVTSWRSRPTTVQRLKTEGLDSW